MTFVGPFSANATFVITRTGDLDPYTTSFGVGYTPDGFDETEADTLAAALGTAALPCLSNGETLVSIDWTYNDGQGQLQHISARNTIGSGQSLATTATQNVSHLLLKRTALPGRQGRGRMFWPSVAEGDVDAIGTVSSTALTKLNTMITGWRSAITASSWADSPLLLHTLSQPPATVITTWTASAQCATQRRRLRR